MISACELTFSKSRAATQSSASATSEPCSVSAMRSSIRMLGLSSTVKILVATVMGVSTGQNSSTSPTDAAGVGISLISAGIWSARSEERRVGKECVSVDLGGRRIIKKNNNTDTNDQ